MNWKRYKDLPLSEKYNETFYIIGMDIGNDATGLAFYNLYENAPEPIDPSGGYGKPSIPTVMQYIPETKEWVFGEYAILNQSGGAEITFKSLVRRLGNFDYLDIDGKPVSVATVLGLFIREQLASVRNINPKAVIVGIVAAVPAYLSEPAHEELTRAFKTAGYEKELIALVPDRECVLQHYLRSRSPMVEKDSGGKLHGGEKTTYGSTPVEAKGSTPSGEKVLLLDYGSREVRGGVYAVGEGGTVKSISSIFDNSIGMGMIDEDVHNLLVSYYNAERERNLSGRKAHPSGHDPTGNALPTPQLDEQLTAFAYQHKDILFQKNIRSKPAKLYFNFVYPPFQQTITHEDIDALLKPYRQQFSRFIRDTLEKTLGADASKTARPKAIPPHDIDAVICVGGGFEMLWAREAAQAIFTASQIRMYKNAKLVTAEGAALVAAGLLGATKGHSVSVEDNHQLPTDIGLSAGDAFLPLAFKGAFWWQKHKPALVLVNSPVSGELRLTVAARTTAGDARQLADYSLKGLPTRPKGTTRLKFGVDFKSNTDMTLSIEDLGFGEMFPKTGYTGEFAVRLA